MGMRAGKRKILRRESVARRCGESQNPNDSRNQRNTHQPRKSSRTWVELWLVWFGVGGAEVDGLAVGGVAVGVGPGFFASQERRIIGETFCGEQALKSRAPVVVIMGATVGFATVGGGFEFARQGGCPFLPGEMALLGEFQSESEGLGLPRLGKDGTTCIAGKLRQSGKALGFGNRIKLDQGSRPINQDRRNPVVRLAGTPVRA